MRSKFLKSRKKKRNPRNSLISTPTTENIIKNYKKHEKCNLGDIVIKNIVRLNPHLRETNDFGYIKAYINNEIKEILKNASQKQSNHLYNRLNLPDEPKIFKNNIQNKELLERGDGSFEIEHTDSNTSNNFINVQEQERNTLSRSRSRSRSSSNSPIYEIKEIRDAIQQQSAIPLYEPRSVANSRSHVPLYSFRGRNTPKSNTRKNSRRKNSRRNNTIRSNSTKSNSTRSNTNINNQRQFYALPTFVQSEIPKRQERIVKETFIG